MNHIRNCILLLIAFTVLAHGVVEVWSESVLEIGAALLVVSWSILYLRNSDHKLFWNPLLWPLAGLVCVGVLQLLLHTTVYPFLSRTELLKLASYVILFFLFCQVFRERKELTNLAWFLMFLGFVVSLLGIIQHFTSQDKIYWFRVPVQGGDIFGPYVNRNHFAGFVELVAPVGLALMMFRGLRRDFFPLAGVLTIIPVGALILSGSRGGIVSFAFQVGVLAMLARKRRRRGKEAPRVAPLGIVTLAALALIVWLGAGKAIERFRGIPTDVSIGRRVAMSNGALHIFLHHPVSGTGLGTLVSVFPRYETDYDGRLVDHVHNDYMELMAEMGLLGGLCGLAFLWILFREARRRYEEEQGHFSRALHAGAIAAICGLLLHSFVDFNLHIPSNAILFLLQASLATSVPLPSESPSQRRGERFIPAQASLEQ
jgi:O-antigen ligase